MFLGNVLVSKQLKSETMQVSRVRSWYLYIRVVVLKRIGGRLTSKRNPSIRASVKTFYSAIFAWILANY